MIYHEYVHDIFIAYFEPDHIPLCFMLQKKSLIKSQKKIKRPYLSKYCEFEVYISLLFFNTHELPLVRILVK